MDCPHGGGEAERVGDSAGLRDDVERPEIFFGELFGGTSQPEELCFDIGFVTNAEGWRRKSMLISGALVALLCGTELAEINGKLMDAGRSHIHFGINFQGWMVIFVDEEKQNTCDLINNIVVKKLSKRK